MRFRYFYCILIGALIIALSGCGMKEKGDDSVSCISSLLGCGVQGNQIVYFENGLLEYEDLSIGKRIVLCSKANCKHEGYDYFTNSNPTCEAASPAGSYYYQAAGIYKGYVYQFLDTDNVNETVLYKSKLNDAGREKIAVLPYTVCKEAGVYLYNDCAYLVGQYNRIEQETDMAAAEDIELIVLQINLKNGKVEKLSNTFSNQTITQINGFYLDENRLYFEYTHLKENITLEGEELEKDWNELLDHELYYIDLDKKEKEKRVSNYDGELNNLLGIEQNQIYYIDKAKESIIIMDCDSGEKRVCLETGALERGSKYSDGVLIYELQNGEVHYYNEASKEDKIVNNIFPTLVNNGYVYIESVDDSEELTTFWMSLEDYVKGKGVENEEE